MSERESFLAWNRTADPFISFFDCWQAAKADSAAEIAALKAQKDGAYLERNRCVALIAQMAIALGLKAGKARTAIEGWSDDWHGCIYIDLPAGQVSWHYHDSQAFLFDALPTYEGKWDGHDTAEKYRRVGLPFESALRTQLEEARKDAMNEGIGKAAAWVDARREAFMLANGHEDPSTGTWEYGSGPHAQAKLDYDSELAEIADGLRELKAPRFSRVSCSQCGQLFGPRDFGYSRCIDHAGRAAIDAAEEPGK